MKIKLTRYPYKDYEVGEIVDLGEEKNRSMVSIQRAVWIEEEEKPARKAYSKADASEKPDRKIKKADKKAKPKTQKPKKLLTNKLGEKVQKRKRSKKKVKKVVEEAKPQNKKSKKLLTNKLSDKVQKRKKLLTSKPPETVQEKKTLGRDSDGRFVNKDAKIEENDGEEPEKKSFWDKLK